MWLVTPRTDASMIGGDSASDAEATLLPSDSTTTPDKTMFPTGTDAVYQALVDTFANSGFVLFVISNEPGGNTLSDPARRQPDGFDADAVIVGRDRDGLPHVARALTGGAAMCPARDRPDAND
jgi:hypothetical protein